MVRSQTPAISAAAIQLILLAIAFKITSCSFIIRSSSAAETFSGVVKLQHPAAFQNRTTHVLIGPDNSHASDTRDFGCIQRQAAVISSDSPAATHGPLGMEVKDEYSRQHYPALGNSRSRRSGPGAVPRKSCQESY